MPNCIDPTVVIRGDVQIGTDNEILPYCVLLGPLVIGDGNYIGPHVTIGAPGQDTRNPRYDSANRRIEIGNGNVIREYTSIQKPRYSDLTRVGHDCFIMQSVHVPHDALVEDKVVIATMVAMGGLVQILEGASLGMGCLIHQRTVIGQYAFVGMGVAVAKNVKPFSRHVPGPRSVNAYAIEKFGFAAQAGQITDYVLKDSQPESENLKELVARYEQFQTFSDRD